VVEEGLNEVLDVSDACWVVKGDMLLAVFQSSVAYQSAEQDSFQVAFGPSNDIELL
jgi:hypothetical protein